MSKELLCQEIEKLIKALDNLSCSSGKYHLVSQAISEIEKELENDLYAWQVESGECKDE